MSPRHNPLPSGSTNPRGFNTSRLPQHNPVSTGNTFDSLKDRMDVDDDLAVDPSLAYPSGVLAQASGQATEAFETNDLMSTLPPSPEPNSLSNQERLARLQIRRAAEKKLKEDNAKLEQSKRPRESSSPVQSSKKPKMQPRFPFQNIVNQSPLRCGFSINAGPLVGNPFAQVPGYGVTIAVQGGRYGQPALVLHIRIKKGDKSKMIVQGTDDFESFVLTWYPGVAIGGTWMMESFAAIALQTLENQEAWVSDEIQSLITPETLPRVGCIAFKSNIHASNSANIAYDGLHTSVAQSLKALFEDGGEYRITICFLPPYGMSYEELNRQTLSHFAKAFLERLPPLHQYLDEKKELLLDVFKTEPVDSFHGGMYRKIPNKKVGNKLVPDPTRDCTYAQLQVKSVWESYDEFRVYASLPVIRDGQFTIGRAAAISQLDHRVFLKQSPSFTIKGKKTVLRDRSSTQQQFQFSKLVFGYVRLGVSKTGLKEVVPEEGSRVNVSWRDGSMETWHGDVIRESPENLKATGTDMCVALSRPAKSKWRKINNELIWQRAKDLELAFIEVIYSNGSAERELAAVQAFCNPAHSNPAVVYLRQAILSNPAQRTVESRDITWGIPPSEDNRRTYRTKLTELKKRFNADQNKLLAAALNVKNCAIWVLGCPGTGKTNVTVVGVWLLVRIGHKVMIAAPSNAGVDASATKVFAERPGDLEHKKVLRLEISSVENEAIIGSKQDFNPDTTDPSVPAAYSETSGWKEHPAYQHALNKLIDELESNEEALARFESETEDFANAYDRFRTQHESKISNFPLGFSLSYRIWELMLQDVKDAEVKYNEQLAKYPNITDRDAAQAEGLISSREELNKSFEYRRFLTDYIRSEGKVSGEQRKAFNALREAMVQRVLAQTDILLVTCNTAGSDAVVKGFDASIVVVDEAGQASLATFVVPLTSQPHWQCAIVIGDTKQLLPTHLSVNSCEVVGNAKISALALAISKGIPHLVLGEQYRMAPAISSFPSRFFYDGQLKDTPVSMQDNDRREIARRVCKKFYGLKESEYWVVNVLRGVARVEENGTSLQNYANADAIGKLVRNLTGEGIDITTIGILSFYSGQKKLISSVIGRDHEGSCKISTVDSFQGLQTSVIIVDIVASSGDDVEDGTGKFSRLTSHVTSPNRLCMAITRPMDCLVVIGQLRSMLRTGSQNRTAISELAKDAEERKLVHHDKETLDSHPEVEARRALITAHDAELETRRAAKEDLGFIRRQVQRMHERPQPKPVEKGSERKVYRTPEGKTSFLLGKIKGTQGTQRERKNAKKAEGSKKREEKEKRGKGKGKERQHTAEDQLRHETRLHTAEDQLHHDWADEMEMEAEKDVQMGGQAE